ncbi:hypothetical protein [Salipiger mucosus]|uniref:Uncharacterized protein n=1 Tax=Salipiger mucosus DSM 16094 TaxID=1123237 RepID=S9RVQ4_9RHOB|nr:hypothetical protein [Salipiger mucosus]EPX82070.1 hypothetical protein Salmuc_02437 [Salipiger mucosus DSM 16094]
MSFTELPHAQQAGILCNDAQFQRFAAERSGFPDGQFSATAAAEYLRSWCRIDSRRQLDTEAEARRRFAVLRTEFDAWTGRIPAQ